MNRRDAFKAFAGVLGLTLVDPVALLSSIRKPLPEPIRIVIPADEGFLIDSISCIGKSNCKVILPNESGFTIPCFCEDSEFLPLSSKVYLPPGTVLEMPGESGSKLLLFGTALHQASPLRPNDVECYYKTYWMDGRRK